MDTTAKSQVVKRSDFDQPWLVNIAKALNEPFRIHRKLWEFCSIADWFTKLDKYSRCKVIGFGVGTEPLPAWFAEQGATVVASDLQSDDWKKGQNSSSLSDIPWEGICDKSRVGNITFAEIDMRSIPDEHCQGGFDFAYSAGSFEHLGSIVNGLRFFCRQMKCLRPGGVAVHTTELLCSGPKLNNCDLVAFSPGDLRRLSSMLRRQGDELLEVDLSMGHSAEDEYIDEEPYGDEPHIKIAIDGRVITSVCLVAVRGKGRRIVSSGNPSVLWVGDAAVSTGFARCTHAACDELHRMGWHVDVIGVNYPGDPHDYPYDIYPGFSPHGGGRDVYGMGRLQVLSRELKPDIVVLLTDPWNVAGYVKALPDIVDLSMSDVTNASDEKAHILTIGWLAVDAKNQDGRPLNDLDHVISWTQFGADELTHGGYNGESSIVGLGVDIDVFKPADKSKARQALFNGIDIPADAFVVGVVGRNQWPRKRLDLSIEYFAHWVKTRSIDNAYLYIHSAPTGERGYDIWRLVEHYGVKGRVMHGSPPMGVGVDDASMVDVYNAMDVYLTTTQGEGWGLPALEAMACAVPCVVPDWSGLGEWVEDAAMRVPCYQTAVSAPINGLAYTVGGIPDRDSMCEQIDLLYRDEDVQRFYSEAGLRLAEGLTWERTGQEFSAVLESVLQG